MLDIVFGFMMCWILLWNMSVTSASTQFSSGVKRSKTMSVIHVYFKWLNFVWCQQFGLMSFSFRLGDTLRQTLVFLRFSLNICTTTRLSCRHIVLLKKKNVSHLKSRHSMTSTFSLTSRSPSQARLRRRLCRPLCVREDEEVPVVCCRGGACQSKHLHHDRAALRLGSSVEQRTGGPGSQNYFFKNGDSVLFSNLWQAVNQAHEEVEGKEGSSRVPVILRRKRAAAKDKNTCQLFIQTDHLFQKYYGSREAVLAQVGVHLHDMGILTRVWRLSFAKVKAHQCSRRLSWQISSHVKAIHSIYQATDFMGIRNIGFMVKRVRVSWISHKRFHCGLVFLPLTYSFFPPVHLHFTDQYHRWCRRQKQPLPLCQHRSGEIFGAEFRTKPWRLLPGLCVHGQGLWWRGAGLGLGRCSFRLVHNRTLLIFIVGLIVTV